jgi:two-component system, OmpR family, response regulator
MSQAPATDRLAPSVMVLEDDVELRGLLLEALRAADLRAEGVGTGRALLERTALSAPDAFVIDIGLPDADGRDVCQALRAQGLQAPVLFLTARDALPDRLAGFDSGGDDYLTKPFSLDELIARLHALIRRSGLTPRTEAAGVVLDPSGHVASCGGQRAQLTPTEFRLLAALCARPGEAVRRRELVRAAWPRGAIVHDNTLDAHVARTRRKLRALPGAPGITTVHGVGYRLEAGSPE